MSPQAQESALSDQARNLRSRGPQLFNMDRSRIAAALHAAVHDLADPSLAMALPLRRSLQEETGLSAAMIEWGLDQAALSFSEEGLLRLAEHFASPPSLRLVPPQLTALVLAGNVFTAGLRSIALPLLAQSPVLIKIPQGGAALISAFAERLREANAELAQHVAIVSFGRDEERLAQALWKHADVVSAYGDDHTMAALRRSVPASARLLEHGHGVSAAYVPANAMTNEAQRVAIAQRLALDVAAYDQLGCLSPQLAFVEDGGAGDHEAFAEALCGALDDVQKLLPRGRVPNEVAGELVQWRGVAAVRGRLFAAASHACAAESGELRFGPGYRHIGIYPCRDAQALWQQLAPLGSHLKSLGVAGSAQQRIALAAQAAAGMSPRLCALGTMQTPPLDAYFDGQPPLSGILNTLQIG